MLDCAVLTILEFGFWAIVHLSCEAEVLKPLARKAPSPAERFFVFNQLSYVGPVDHLSGWSGLRHCELLT